jgi:hypothetical protein
MEVEEVLHSLYHIYNEIIDILEQQEVQEQQEEVQEQQEEVQEQQEEEVEGPELN